MKRQVSFWGLLWLPIILIAAATGCESSLQSPDVAQPGKTFAIVGASVIPMSSKEILPDQTVVVSNGKIVALGPANEIDPPRATVRIDGRGYFVMPGLYDLHVHQYEDRELLFYLANGVTTILNLHGNDAALARRAALNSGEKFGPRLFTCGPPVYGEDVDAQASIVKRIVADGYDCVKIRGENWTKESYKAVGDAAEAGNIMFLGHAPANLPFSVVLDDGRQRIVHLEEILYTSKDLYDWLTIYRHGGSDDVNPDPSIALGGPVNALASRMVELGMWIIPTQIVIDNFHKRTTDAGMESLSKRSYLHYLDPVLRREWGEQQLHWRTGEIRFRQQAALQYYMLSVFNKTGLLIAAGTDSELEPGLQTMPGWALHEELGIYVDAGLSPYEALRTATSNAAAFLGRENEGVIAEGARADLLLIENNPLEDVNAARRPAVVVADGQWYSRNELDKRLAALEVSYAPIQKQLDFLDSALATEDIEKWFEAWRTLESPGPSITAYFINKVDEYAYNLMDAGSMDQALKIFERNVETFPQSTVTHASLASALLNKGETAQAIEHYKKAIELDPANEDARYELHEILTAATDQ